MPKVHVYWRTAQFDAEQQASPARQVAHTGTLTDEHPGAFEEGPLLIEERSERVYRAGELPPGTVVYLEGPPGQLPALGEKARAAGFHIEHAEKDPGVVDRPHGTRDPDEPEETGERRRERY